MSTATSGAVDMALRSGLKLLSLDAGGVQGVSQLQILDHVMQKISHDTQGLSQGVVKRPCDVFDAIGGTGTGGLISMFLVILKMTAKEALEEFTKLIGEVYQSPSDSPTKRTHRLQNTIYGILKKYGVDEDTELIPANQSPSTCRLIIPIMYKNNVGIPCVLRNHVIRQEPPTNLTIAEAMLATSGTSPMFNPISIGKDFSIFEYISGDLGLSNPIREVIAGAHYTFGDEATVACLLSIGCGRSGVKSVPLTSDATARIDFLERVAMDSEKAAQEMATQMRHLTLYHRFSVRYGLETARSRAWLEPETIAAHTTVYLNDLEVAKVVDSCIDSIKTGHGSATLEQLRHSSGANILPLPLPPLTRNYVERKNPMDFVEKALFAQDGAIESGSKILVVTGIGGCGKTQLVRKFVENRQDRFISTFLVDGSSKDFLRRDIVRHVRSLNTAHSQDSFDDSMTFLSQSIPDGQRLLVVDNVDDPTLDLSPFLPRWTDGVVIVTSRNVSRGQLSPSAHLQLDVMSLDESVELLERGSGREWPPSEAAREVATEVANELGRHPIALVQAISYMSSTGYTAQTYISRLRGYRKQLLDDPATSQLDMRYLTAFAAFDASYHILPSNAQNTLHLLSFFQRQNFPLDLITLAAEGDFSIDDYSYLPRSEEFERGKEYLKETFCPCSEWNPREMDSIIISLRDQSLIAVVLAPDVTLLEMHSLVHEWSRFRIPGGMLERIQAAAIRLLCCGARQDNFRMMQYLSSHVQALSFAWDRLHVNDAASFGFILVGSGIYANAAKLQEKVHGLLRIQLGTDHIYTILASANLAVAYGQLGRYADAEVLESEVLRKRKQLLGMDHPHTIDASTNLALTYKHLGRYTDAELLQVEVLRKRKQLLGTDHPRTISDSANLALTYRHLGRYTDAELLQVEVLRKRKQLLGMDHPDTIDASTNLALTYKHLGRYTDAELLQVEVLRKREQLLGIDHPHTIMASAHLAFTYGRLGRYTDAEVLEVEVLRKRKQLLGMDHPDTLDASTNLALTYGQSGRYEDAELLQVDVLRRRKQILGTNHPYTVMASANLALTYTQRGRYADAEVLQVESLGQFEQLLGTDHPDTITASAHLAFTYGRLGRYTDAEVLEVEVLRKRKQLLGMDHPDTLEASANLALTYGQLERYADAEVLESEVLRKRKQLLGMDHPNTIDASTNLAHTYNRLGRYTDAEVLQLETMRQFKQLLGPDHPDTVRASANLAATYWQLGRYVEAEVLQVTVLSQLKELHGTGHPDTIGASANLATTYAQLGRYADAEVLSKEAVTIFKSVLGPQHPDTLRAVEFLAFLDKSRDRQQNAASQATSGPPPSAIDKPVSNPRLRDRLLARLRESFS